MALIKFSSTTNHCVSIPYWFIKDYMPKALGSYVKIYIYLFGMCASLSETSISLEETAKTLDVLHSDIIQCLKYWDAQGIVSFKYHSDEDFELSFSLTPPATTEENNLPLSKTIISQTRPNYTMRELTIYKTENPNITKLFLIAEEYLGRLLSPTDEQVLFGLYDWLHMPLDLIEYLLEYCASNNHTSIRYIEKVAINWIDNNITTLEAAKAKVMIEKKYLTILSHLGISSQSITKVQKDYIDKWMNDYNLSMEIILEGCRRTVAQTSNPNIKYLDSILSSWASYKVKSLEDIEQLDKTYINNLGKSALSSQTKQTKQAANKNTRFTNIYSHNWDFEELEKLEMEYIERKLHGNS